MSETLVAVRVELPAYSQVLTVNVPRSATVLDVKQQITSICNGAPRVDGQRLIWRGRCIQDHERIEDIWKNPEEARIVHLAVHPSAWSSTPPEIPPTPSSEPDYQYMRSLMQVPNQYRQPTPTTTAPQLSSPVAQPLAYIHFKHQNALLALTQGRLIPPSDLSDLEQSRTWAIHVVKSNGWEWPALIDEPFPNPLEQEWATGVRYQRLGERGREYLQVRNPDAAPTPMQAHALKVLTYTFPLLTLPAPPPALLPQTTSERIQLPILQQGGNVRVQANQQPPVFRFNPHQNPHPLRDIALRQLVVPLVMLFMRTVLLLYFVSPARKPVFGIMIGAWIVYESWAAIRAAFGAGEHARARARAAAQAPPAPAPAAQAQGQGNAPIRPAPDPNVRHPPQGRRGENNSLDALADVLGNMNLPAEEATLTPAPGHQPSAPGFLHKFTTFFSLLFLTLHPAVWNRRRTALRQREGRLRTEAHAREAEGEEADERQARVRAELVAQHERRPAWVREYVGRARRAEWVDDL